MLPGSALLTRLQENAWFCRPGKHSATGLFYWNAEVTTLEHTIGNTPLVKLQRLTPDNGSEIWVKLEGNNPAGSVKVVPRFP